MLPVRLANWNIIGSSWALESIDKMLGANLEVMGGTRPFLMTNLKTREGLAEVVGFIERQGMLAQG
mgnify:CR=1 FL=1